MIDKKILHISSATILAVLLVALLLPFESSGRIVAAILLLPAAAASWFLLKKRSIPSINKDQVLILMGMIGLVYLTILYLSGLKFGFYTNPYAINVYYFFAAILPTTAIILSSEVIRNIIRAQDSHAADIICYLCCVISDVLINSNIPSITSFNRFMDVVAVTLFPSIIANLLYHYLTKRYGMYPNMVYRLLITLYVYLIPYIPNVPNVIFAFANIFVPILIFLFIDSLYEKKVRYALQRKSKLTVPITVIALAIMIFVVMVISNQFFIGTYVIATESMTGELNKGDAAIYERYDDQTITEGQVIAFEKNGIVVIHRVVDIQIINGQTRYFTKGDANEGLDSGFIFDSNIIGLINFKIPYIGYPTLWLRSLFSR